MNKGKALGTLLYYLSWPLIWFYGPLNIRVRVIIKCNSEILLVKNWFGPSSMQLPGGGKKFSEKPLDTAVREVKEELDIDISNNSKLLNEDVSIVKSNGILYRYYYVISEFSKKPKITPSKEIASCFWVDNNSKEIPKSVRSYL